MNKYCVSNLYTFGVSENLPMWEWAKADQLKNIVGFHNIAELNYDVSNFPSAKVIKTTNLGKSSRKPVDKTTELLSKILEEDQDSADTDYLKNKNRVKDIKFISIHSGESFCFLETNKNILCGFGYNHNNILGLDEDMIQTNQRCEPIFNFDSRIVNLTFSNEHAIAHLANGKAFCWGQNRFHQISYEHINKFDCPTAQKPKFSLDRNPVIFKEYEAKKADDKKAKELKESQALYDISNSKMGSNINLLKSNFRENVDNKELRIIKTTSRMSIADKGYNATVKKNSGDGPLNNIRKDSNNYRKDSDNISVDLLHNYSQNMMSSRKSIQVGSKDNIEKREFLLNKGLSSRRLDASKKVIIAEGGNLTHMFEENFNLGANLNASKKSIASKPIKSQKLNFFEKKDTFDEGSNRNIERKTTLENLIGHASCDVITGKKDTQFSGRLNLKTTNDMNYRITTNDTNMMPSLTTGRKLHTQNPSIIESKTDRKDLRIGALKKKIDGNQQNDQVYKSASGANSNRAVSNKAISNNVIKNLELNKRAARKSVIIKDGLKNNLSIGQSILNLANLSKDNESFFSRNKNFSSFKALEDKERILVHKIFCSNSCTYYVTTLGIFSIGNKESGLLGFVNTALQLNFPVPIDLNPTIRIRGVSCTNSEHVLIWDDLGRLYSWGSNMHGKLGIDKKTEEEEFFTMKPQQVEIIGKKKAYFAFAAVNASFVITSKGHIYYWGKPFNSMEGKGSIFIKPSRLELTPLSKEIINKLDGEDQEWYQTNRPKKKKRRQKIDDNSNSDSEEQDRKIEYKEFDYTADKIVFVKMVSYGYSYAFIDLKGRIYTAGENNSENLGYKIKDENWNPEEANLISQLSDSIVMDASQSEKNLFMLLENRTLKNEFQWWNSPVCSHFIRMNRKFTKSYQKDLMKYKTDFEIKTPSNNMIEKGLYETYQTKTDFHQYSSIEKFEPNNIRKVSKNQENQGKTVPNFYIKSKDANKSINRSLLSDRNKKIKSPLPIKNKIVNILSNEDEVISVELDDKQFENLNNKSLKEVSPIREVKKKYAAINEQPFQPSTKEKIQKDFMDSSPPKKKQSEKRQDMSGSELEEDPFDEFEQKELANPDQMSIYRNFLETEMKRTKSDAYVTIENSLPVNYENFIQKNAYFENPESYSFFMKMNLNPCNNEKIDKFHTYNEFLSVIRKFVFGEFTFDPNKTRKILNLREQIETNKNDDLKQVFLDAIKNNKEKELFKYLWSTAQVKDLHNNNDPRKFLRGTGAEFTFSQNEKIYNKAKKTQDYAHKQIDRHRKITGHQGKELAFNRKAAYRYWEKSKALNEKIKGDKLKKHIVPEVVTYESKDERILGFVNNGIKETQKYNNCISQKYQRDKDKHVLKLDAYEDRMKDYDKRMFQKNLRKKGKAPLMGFLYTILFVRMLEQFQSVMEGMQKYYDSPKFLSVFAKIIQRCFRRRQLKLNRNKNVNAEEYELSRRLDRMRQTKQLKHFMNLTLINEFKFKMVIMTVKIRTAQRCIRRFFMKKLEVTHFERTILMHYFNKKTKKLYLSRLWNDEKGMLHHKDSHIFTDLKETLSGHNFFDPNFKADTFQNQSLMKVQNTDWWPIPECTHRLVDTTVLLDYVLAKMGITHHLQDINSSKVLGSFDEKYEMAMKTKECFISISKNIEKEFDNMKGSPIFWKYVYHKEARLVQPLSQHNFYFGNINKKILEKIVDTINIQIDGFNLTTEKIMSTEAQIKMNLVNEYYASLQVFWRQDFDNYKENLEYYAMQNITEINHQRAKEMLRIGPYRLKTLFMLGKMRFPKKTNSWKDNDKQFIKSLTIVTDDLTPPSNNKTGLFTDLANDKSSKDKSPKLNNPVKSIIKKNVKPLAINNHDAMTGCEEDFLPFGNRVLNFAEKIKAPKYFTTPTYNLDIEDNFERLFENYHRQFMVHFKQAKRRDASPLKGLFGGGTGKSTQYKKTDVIKSKLVNFAGLLLSGKDRHKKNDNNNKSPTKKR